MQQLCLSEGISFSFNPADSQALPFLSGTFFLLKKKDTEHKYLPTSKIKCPLLPPSPQSLNPSDFTAQRLLLLMPATSRCRCVLGVFCNSWGTAHFTLGCCRDISSPGSWCRCCKDTCGKGSVHTKAQHPSPVGGWSMQTVLLFKYCLFFDIGQVMVSKS